MSSDQIQNEQKTDELSKETLLEFVKKQVNPQYFNIFPIQEKQINMLQKKLNAVEDKFKKTLQDQKMILKDKDILEKGLQSFLNQVPFKFLVQDAYGNITKYQYHATLGKYDLEQIYSLIQKREEEKQSVLTKLIEDTNKEKFEMEYKYKAMVEKQVSGMDNQTKKLIEQLKEQIQDLENNNTKLAREIIELNDIIQMKNIDIMQLQKVEEEFTNYKTQMMIKEMEDQSLQLNNQRNMQKKIQDSNSLNDYLNIKNKIEKVLKEKSELQQVIKALEEQNLQLKEQLSKAKNNREEETFEQIYQQTPQSNYQNDDDEENPFEDGDKKSKKIILKVELSKSTQTDFQEKFIQVDKQEQKKLDDLNQEYLKNVIFKYFLYQETKNTKEAHMLMSAIMTILKMTKYQWQEEKKMIEEAKEKGKMWQAAKSYLTDNMFCYKLGLSHESNMHQIQNHGMNSLANEMNSSINMK